MGQLRDRMEADLKVGGYSTSTQKIYLLYARQFAAHFMRSPAEMGAEEIRAFLLYLVEERKVSRETMRQVRAALRFLYQVTLNRPTEIEWVPVPRRERRLPLVLSGTEIAALLAAVHTLKYRMLVTAVYAAGLRISEACRLQPENIDAKRRTIRILGKGNKDRYTLLSARLLHQLRDYWRHARPTGEWLFPGGTRAGHASPETTRKVLRKAAQAASIGKRVTPHLLRHCFATHLIDAGAPLSLVQALLGHASLQTTGRYTHTSIEQIARTQSPFDLLGTPAATILG